MQNNKVQKVEAIDLRGVNVIEDGVAPSLMIMSEDSSGPGAPAPKPAPEPGDTLPG
jgi:hypothetical protein